MAAETRANARGTATAGDTALEFAARLGLRPLATPTSQPPNMRRSTLVDDLVLEYASPRTQRLLREYDAQTQVRALTPTPSLSLTLNPMLTTQYGTRS